MSLNFAIAKETVHQPRIMIIGIGGGGGNAVGNMIAAELNGATFAIANTDMQVMEAHPADVKLHLGRTLTEGLGAGANPEIGAAAAEEAYDEICEAIRGSHMVFITAGMGGGTGSGAAPVIARAAREQGILTVAVVTKPFTFEGARRSRVAEAAIAELQDVADTVIVIPNQNLFRIATERTTLGDAFKMADDVLYRGVRGVTDLMLVPGIINLDFNDVKTVMSEMGQAMMGTGEAEGERRAIEAAEMAISSPLLDGVSMAGAKGVLINITGGSDLTLYEVDEAANRIREEVDPEANIIFGTAQDASMEGKIRVSVVATGLGEGRKKTMQTLDLNVVKSRVEAKPMAEEISAPKTATDVRDFATAAAAKKEREEEQTQWDDLEIPAFLRRQVN
ncbi:MAG: cell division protein FtsZ [Alphaproteobacteria bacterium CG_4_10_14_0_8_um_filter_53_9]|nr:MAG: cell division protein FtsZ [Alphaproteobacteria bacterium CG_4_10_14_0_8_um_filter_53_9]